MKTRHDVALSMLAGVALGAFTVQGLHAEDKYIRNLPLDALSVPIIPPDSTLNLQPGRSPDGADQMSGYRPSGNNATTPSIGLSIKAPLDDRK
jgi:hypothetical protein